MKSETLERIIHSIDPVNAEYIIQNGEIVSGFQRATQYLKNGKSGVALYVFKEAKKKAGEFKEYHLTPDNVRVGDGVTINLWTDRHAATVIKVTKSMVVVQRDTAILNPDFKPEWIPGGFAAHCTNQNEQTYTYRRDPNGAITKIRWSHRYQRYGTPGNVSLSKGRHEYYDYNF